MVPLDYARPTKPWWREARWWHWALLAAWAGVFVAAVLLLWNPLLWGGSEDFGWGILGTPAAPFHDSGDEKARYAWQAGVYLGVFLLSQWLFLLPRGSWRIRSGDEVRPMRRAMVVAGLIGMLVSVGLLATLMDLTGLWPRITVRDESDGQDFRLIWGLMLLIWAFWFVLFYWYGRSLDRYTFLSRSVRLLVAGSILETLVSASVYAWIGRDRDCQCARGSYSGLVFGLTALAWLFGPALFLLWWREKRRRERLVE